MPGLNALSLRNEQFRVMAVDRHKAVRMLDKDHSPVPAAIPGVDYYPIGGSVDFGAFGYGNIQAGVVFRARRDRR